MKAMTNDYKKAFSWYCSQGVNLKTAAMCMDVSNLGDFYKRSNLKWWALDDAAKIYPLTTTENRMTVFRLSVYLKENVIPEILQIALHFTVKRFPTFATDIKNGVFWHYLETVKRRYQL